MQAPVYTIVELSGHIIDSLTLGKVIDKIQFAGLRYQINDFQIGQRKNDFSTAQISLWADSQAQMDEMLTELKPYGALPVASQAIHLAACPDDGTLPEEGYVRRIPPTELFWENTWLPVNRDGFDVAIVVDVHQREARYQKVSELRKGDMVVVGKVGVKILPELGEKTNAQPIAG